MRITRVALSFFSVGFLAGSFEQAAGLGNAAPGQPAPTYAVALASLTLPSAIELAAPSLGGELKSEPVTKWMFLPDSAPGHRTAAPIAAGDAKAAEAMAALGVIAGHPGGEAQVEPVALSSAPEAAPPSRKLRPFFDPLPPEDEPLVVPEPKIATRPQEFVLPFEKGRVTSMFNQGRRHPAIDLAGPLGTPVYATTRKQRITFAGWRGGYGNLVITRDPQGRHHYYGHLHRILGRVGAVLEQGETLGLLGTTGRSTGPHVHYEVRTPKGRHLDPSKLLFAGSVKRGYAWNTPRPEVTSTRLAARAGQPRPR
jgi:murein DD-endopeptidase MepM/ murein hydrolase activator NlpD